MKRVITIYGLIAGSIVAAMMFITMPMYTNGLLSSEYGELVGYTTMVIALSMIFFGVKSYRDNQADGVVSFWKAVKIGLLISSIAAVMYALAWEIVYPILGDEILKGMTEKHLAEVTSDGGSAAQLKAEAEKFAMYAEYYKNPFIRFAMTLMEIFPVGIIISFISAAMLRRKEFLPATESVEATSSSFTR